MIDLQLVLIVALHILPGLIDCTTLAFIILPSSPLFCSLFLLCLYCDYPQTHCLHTRGENQSILTFKIKNSDRFVEKQTNKHWQCVPRILASFEKSPFTQWRVNSIWSSRWRRWYRQKSSFCAMNSNWTAGCQCPAREQGREMCTRVDFGPINPSRTFGTSLMALFDGIVTFFYLISLSPHSLITLNRIDKIFPWMNRISQMFGKFFSITKWHSSGHRHCHRLA